MKMLCIHSLVLLTVGTAGTCIKYTDDKPHSQIPSEDPLFPTTLDIQPFADIGGTLPCTGTPDTHIDTDALNFFTSIFAVVAVNLD